MFRSHDSETEARPSEFQVEVLERDGEGQPILSIKPIPKAKPAFGKP
ncbi:MAG: hypothetical protein QM755_10400 [Luteolibacter sp.]